MHKESQLDQFQTPGANVPLNGDKLRRSNSDCRFPGSFLNPPSPTHQASTGNSFIYCCLIIYTYALCIPSYLHCQVMCIDVEALLSLVLLLVSSLSVCLMMT